MIRGRNFDSIPADIIIEILSRLPTNSIARCRCVSKLWRSMLLRPYFTELFLTRSSARPPRLLFAVKRDNSWCFLTTPRLQNPYEKSSSLVVAAEFQMKFPGDTSLNFMGYAYGFTYFSRYTPNFSYYEGPVSVICNPSTGQYVSLPLPKKRTEGDGRSFLGFDPIDKQYKLLFLRFPCYYNNDEPDQILTLGTGNYSWRKIYFPLDHCPCSDVCHGVCINGILYYLAKYEVVCFDVRSETSKFIDRIDNCFPPGTKRQSKLINYKGKLGMIGLGYNGSQYPGRWRSFMFYLWVIKDLEEPYAEWSEYFSFRWSDDLVAEWSDVYREVKVYPRILSLLLRRRHVLQHLKGHENISVNPKLTCNKIVVRLRLKSINEFDSLRVLDDVDEFT